MSTFDEDLILLGAEAEQAEDILSRLAALLHSRGYVKDSFRDAVVEREKLHPTGLPSEGVYVAIPHADPVHVNQSAIAVATLKEPVSFSMMGSPDVTVGVKIVVMLAIHKPEEHLQLLRNFMKLFQDKELLLGISEATTRQRVYELLGGVVSAQTVTK
ncbi:PTS sugar transporter subunit IIA [Brevibacillus humidisoli]|uniref:PTS sugar transporter subunit IIA n=1 Tax=Brevibacillus humidisoli TaxID=2895522 RepID=UPI001E493032|nr:PTS sugar transporter subunit IIA [Brevibacillus humidisoli]UFJ39867.1 PTS sugar transporter subunit IIA [Brevibacillus humidisoli]